MGSTGYDIDVCSWKPDICLTHIVCFNNIVALTEHLYLERPAISCYFHIARARTPWRMPVWPRGVWCSWFNRLMGYREPLVLWDIGKWFNWVSYWDAGLNWALTVKNGCSNTKLEYHGTKWVGKSLWPEITPKKCKMTVKDYCRFLGAPFSDKPLWFRCCQGIINGYMGFTIKKTL